MSALTDALMSVAITSAPKVRSLVDGALADAKAVGGDAGKQAAVVAAVIAATLEDVARGRVSPDAGREACSRAFAALEMVRAGATEDAQKRAAARAAEALGIARDVGLALLKAGLAAGAAAL